MKPILYAAAIAVVALVVLGAGETPQTLRVRSLELVDDSGRVRAQLNVETDGEVVLRLRDVGGAIRAKLGASQEGSGLVLLNQNAEPGAQLLAKPAGTTLTLIDPDGTKRVIEP